MFLSEKRNEMSEQLPGPWTVQGKPAVDGGPVTTLGRDGCQPRLSLQREPRTGGQDVWKNSREKSWKHTEELDLLSRSAAIHVHHSPRPNSATAHKGEPLL